MGIRRTGEKLAILPGLREKAPGGVNWERFGLDQATEERNHADAIERETTSVARSCFSDHTARTQRLGLSTAQSARDRSDHSLTSARSRFRSGSKTQSCAESTRWNVTSEVNDRQGMSATYFKVPSALFSTKKSATPDATSPLALGRARLGGMTIVLSDPPIVPMNSVA